MKDFKTEELKRNEINAYCDVKTTIEKLNFCIDRIYGDRQHYFTEDVSNGMTFEELLGALITARHNLELIDPEDGSYMEEGLREWVKEKHPDGNTCIYCGNEKI